MLKLTVVNRMLGTLGQAPINSLQASSRWLGACLSALEQSNREIQAKGWWFNEENLTIQPSALDGRSYLPGDHVGFITDEPNIVERAGKLYDTKEGTELLAREVKIHLRRLISFENLPEIAADYIAADAILWFQSNYDGDQIKTQGLARSKMMAEANLKSEDTRQRKANMVDNNRDVQLVRSFSRRQGYRIPIR